MKIDPVTYQGQEYRTAYICIKPEIPMDQAISLLDAVAEAGDFPKWSVRAEVGGHLWLWWFLSNEGKIPDWKYGQMMRDVRERVGWVSHELVPVNRSQAESAKAFEKATEVN